jgi:Nif11 domain
MSKEGLNALRARVQQDPDLARRLHRIAPERFVGEVVEIAAGLGISVDDADVQQAIMHGRQAWGLRWIL